MTAPLLESHSQTSCCNSDYGRKDMLQIKWSEGQMGAVRGPDFLINRFLHAVSGLLPILYLIDHADLYSSLGMAHLKMHDANVHQLRPHPHLLTFPM